MSRSNASYDTVKQKYIELFINAYAEQPTTLHELLDYVFDEELTDRQFLQIAYRDANEITQALIATGWRQEKNGLWSREEPMP